MCVCVCVCVCVQHCGTHSGTHTHCVCQHTIFAHTHTHTHSFFYLKIIYLKDLPYKMVQCSTFALLGTLLTLVICVLFVFVVVSLVEQYMFYTVNVTECVLSRNSVDLECFLPTWMTNVIETLRLW